MWPACIVGRDAELQSEASANENAVSLAPQTPETPLWGQGKDPHFIEWRLECLGAVDFTHIGQAYEMAVILFESTMMTIRFHGDIWEQKRDYSVHRAMESRPARMGLLPMD